MKNCFIYKICFLAIILPIVLFTCAVTNAEKGYEWYPLIDWVVVDKVDSRLGKISVTRDTITKSSYESYSCPIWEFSRGWKYVLVDSIPRSKRWDQ